LFAVLAVERAEKMLALIGKKQIRTGLGSHVYVICGPRALQNEYHTKKRKKKQADWRYNAQAIEK
jgi:hypothetical protein